MAEKFPNLKKETDIQVQEAQRVPNKMNPNRPTSRHSIIKMAKVKERIFKAAREKELIKREPPPGYQPISLQKHCSKVAGHKINIQKLVAFLYINNEISERKPKKTIPHKITHTHTHTKKTSGINLTKEMKDMC